jgi:hypothetical protein
VALSFWQPVQFMQHRLDALGFMERLIGGYVPGCESVHKLMRPDAPSAI